MTGARRFLLACSFAVLLYGQAVAQGIYTCVDAKGRKITSDRPIAECLDRMQKEVTATGTVKRLLMPPPTAQEQAALEEKEKQDLELRQKVAKEKLRDLALLKRYPDSASHDKERAIALERVIEDIKTATQRLENLTLQRNGLNNALEVYKDSPGKAPPAIKRQLDEVDAAMATQKRLLADQEAEKRRITERFEAEMAKLKVLWEVAAAPNSPRKP